ncbi:MAG TPA: hypothetical protein PK388_09250 [Kiritimatiellia bacterium]|nr:hypothetical protein [Kiritimatiellia bacterium]
MKTSAFRILPLLVAGWFAAGCVVRSIQPWLSDESRVKEPSLVGAWHDAKANCTAFFSESDDSDCDYDVLLVTDNQDVSRFTASLHKLDELHVLTVGPGDPDNLNGIVLLPGHLLLKAEMAGDELKLHGIDLDAFRARAEQAQVALAAGGSQTEGYTLAGDTEEVEAFARAQVADPDFFDAQPLYSFRKLPAAAPEK